MSSVITSVAAGLMVVVCALSASAMREPERATSPAPVSAPTDPTPKSDVPTLSSLAWLSGVWIREANGSRAEEHWTSAEGTMMIGMARTNRGGKTTMYEHLRIESCADGVFYIAIPKGQKETSFKLTSVRGDESDAEAVFENPEHDFPTKIVYMRKGDALTATISGEIGGKARSIEFAFEWGK